MHKLDVKEIERDLSDHFRPVLGAVKKWRNLSGEPMNDVGDAHPAKEDVFQGL